MNKCFFIGRIANDLEVKKTQTGKEVVNVSLAVKKYGNKDEADFFNISVWNKGALALQQHTKKGDMIAFECMAHNDSYEKDGKKFTVTRFTSVSFDFLPNGKKQEPKYNRTTEEQVAVTNADYAADDIPF